MSHPITTIDVSDAPAVGRCFAAFKALRPHLDPAEFLRRVSVQAEEGYRIACIEQDGVVVAAAGYRVANFLAWGRVVYIDDLITLPGRTRAGFGGALLDWLIALARQLDCDAVHLDSGHARHDAHRLYLNKGFRLSSHHFALNLR